MEGERESIGKLNIRTKAFKGKARNIEGVYRKVKKEPLAGRMELEFILQNQNSPESNLLKDGKRHYFLGGSTGKIAHFLVWNGFQFFSGHCPMDAEWYPEVEQIVLLGT